MKLCLMYASEPRTVHEMALECDEPCTLSEALERSGWLICFPELNGPGVSFGIWGRRAELGHLLRDGDRVEAYRDLRVDPMVARRERFTGQGARGTGLFSRRRPGAKPGY